MMQFTTLLFSLSKALAVILTFAACVSAQNTSSPKNSSAKDDELNINDSSYFSYKIYSKVNAGSNVVPFWFYANSHGLVRPGSNFNSISGFSSSVLLTPQPSAVNVRIGSDLVNRISDQRNSIHFQQLYGEFSYRKLNVRVGRFYRMNDFDSALEGITTGFLVESHNATPYSRISLETDGFAALPKTGGHLLVRLRYSDGILGSKRRISSPYLHHKSLQLRADVNRISIQFGIFHSVMWGGRDDDDGRLPSSFNDYLRVVLSRSADEDSRVDVNETLNRLGNSIGVYEAGFTYRASNFRVVGYRHLFLEDELSVTLQSPWDGTWGLGVIQDEENHPVRAVVYEHINSIQQESRKNLAQGRANFYNNGIYTDGWSYHGRLMGNPLFTFNPSEREVDNNVLVAHHLGIKGDFSKRFSYKTMLTYSRNYGVCRDQVITGTCSILPGDPVPQDLELTPRGELRQDRISGLLQLNYLLLSDQNLYFHTSIAADGGEFWDDRYGVMLGFSMSR